MIRTNKWVVSMTLTTTMMMGSVLVMAQDPTVSRPRISPAVPTRSDDGQERPAMPVMVQGSDFNVVGIISTEASFDTQVIMAAPFSAVAVTESVQVLADGNRIVHKSSTSISRDSQGRTRREQDVTYVTTESSSPESFQTIWINDPVAGVTFLLNTKNHIATKSPTATGFMRAAGGGGGRGGAMAVPPGATLRSVNPAQSAPGTVGGAVGTGEGGGMVTRTASPPGDPATARVVTGAVYSITASPAPPQPPTVRTVTGERITPDTIQLGKQTIEGVEAEGTKVVLTIPAGQIGNEQPIVIENESWYSADLHQVVMTRHSDPRYGESTYKLTNISRGEPDRSLFEIPSDYTVRETSVREPSTMGAPKAAIRKRPDDQKEPPQ